MDSSHPHWQSIDCLLDARHVPRHASFLTRESISAVEFAQNVAENFSSLEEHQQFALVSSLLQVRHELPSEADAVFERASLKVAWSGSIEDLFSLGNYIFGPRLEGFGLSFIDGAPPLDAV